MCGCGDDPWTPFCGGPGCRWPDDTEDCNLAITNYLTTARLCAQSGLMSFQQYLDLCVEFDPNDAEEGE